MKLSPFFCYACLIKISPDDANIGLGASSECCQSASIAGLCELLVLSENCILMWFGDAIASSGRLSSEVILRLLRVADSEGMNED